jgi:internalin A
MESTMQDETGEAGRRIRQAVQDGSQSLDLSRNQLTAVPESVGKLTALTLLDLSGNQLTAVPDWVGDLTALTSLDLSRNQLTAVPESVGKLTALTSLDLRGNQLTVLPESVGKLTALTSLDLRGNQLTVLPESVGKLTALTLLDLSGNQLTAVPDWVGDLTALTSLDLSRNQLTAVPESVGKLTALTSLDLSRNGLTVLPESVGKLTALTTLVLRDNQLTAVPDWVGDLTALTFLGLGGNQLTVLPESVGKLTALTFLDLSRNGLTVLPESVGDLTALTTLVLRDNQLTAVPDWVGDLTALTFLDLGGNQLTVLPESVGKLTALTSLGLGGNQLTVLPESVGDLTALTLLDLGGNQLTVLPESVGDLTALTTLVLRDNQLTAVPDWVGDLTALTFLDLGGNQLTVLPESVGDLTALTFLDLGGNQLTVLPESVGKLTALTTLHLRGNQLTVLPESVGDLTALTTLHLRGNQLTAVPDWVGDLTALTTLDLGGNQLTVLPESVGNLTALTTLDLDGNPLVSPPPEVVAAGMSAVLEFLRALRDGGAEQWVSKMLVVGEPMVGKTSVTRALCGLPYDRDELPTHGVHLDPLDLPHPSRAGTVMRLNVWDFGGQLEYRATQRFYLTDRSLFMLVWNPRVGSRSAGGRVAEWLQVIRAVAPGSPVVIVATHCTGDEAPYDLDEAALRREYPQIAAIARVDCLNGEGIAGLRETIRHVAAALPLMGVRWPASWAAAASRLSGHPDRVVSLTAADELMAGDPVLERPGVRQMLRQVLHDRGDILHYPHDPELAEWVILQPAWVDRMIVRVLDSRPLAAAGGILSRDHRAELWHDLDNPGLRDMLTALMECFDLAYRLDSPGHADVALVVDKLPGTAPASWPPRWQQILDDPDMHQVSLTYKLGSRQAGIPSWFIAREHRFTTGTAWARGVLLTHRGQPDPAWALLEDDDQPQPALRLTVRGRLPHTFLFLSLLNEGFTGIISDRYPGLSVRRLISCSCTPAQPCGHEFDYDTVLRYLEHGVMLRCDQTLQEVDPRTLLLGLRPSRIDEAVAGIQAVQAAADRIERSQLGVLDSVRDLLRHRGEQGSSCPSIFTLTSAGGRPGARRYELQLYCEQPDGPHPLPDGAGRYQLTDIPAWIRASAPYLKALLTLVSLAVPLAAPVLAGLGGITLPAADKARLDLTADLLGDLGGIPALPAGAAALSAARAPDLRQLRQGLLALDPDGEWGGLRERQLPESRGIAYLCPHHREALRYPQEAPEPPNVPLPAAGS